MHEEEITTKLSIIQDTMQHIQKAKTQGSLSLKITKDENINIKQIHVGSPRSPSTLPPHKWVGDYGGARKLSHLIL